MNVTIEALVNAPTLSSCLGFFMEIFWTISFKSRWILFYFLDMVVMILSVVDVQPSI